MGHLPLFYILGITRQVSGHWQLPELPRLPKNAEIDFNNRSLAFGSRFRLKAVAQLLLRSRLQYASIWILWQLSILAIAKTRAYCTVTVFADLYTLPLLSQAW